MTTRMVLLTAVFLLVSAAATIRAQTAAGSPSSQQPTEVTPLELGKPIEREIAGGQSHTYRITLATGQYMHVTIDQRGVDVVVVLRAPGGVEIIQMDGLNTLVGTEELSYEVADGGEYLLEVRARTKQANSGRYELKLEKAAAVEKKHRARIAAERLLMEGKREQAQQNGPALERAAQKYAEAIEKWREAGERKWEGNTLVHLVGVRFNLSQYVKAREHADQLLAIRRETGDRRGEGDALNTVGVISMALSQHQKALDYFEQALAISREFKDRRVEGLALNNLGLVYINLSEYEKARKYYEEALPLWRELKDQRFEAMALSNIGMIYIYGNRSQYERGRNYFEQALTIRREIKDKFGEAQTLTNLGAVSSSLGQDERARDYFEQSLAISRELKDKRGEGVALSNLGSIHVNLGQHQRARDYLEQGLAIRREIKDRNGEGSALTNLGNVYEKLGQLEKAQSYLEQALGTSREIKDKRIEGGALGSLGNVYFFQGQYAKALDQYEQSLAISRAGADRSGEAKTLYGIARAEQARGNLLAARLRIEATLQIVESLRASFVSQESRASFFSSVQEYYEFYINLLMLLHEQQPTEGHHAAALQASEHARARLLLELLGEANADIRQGVDPVLRERESALQQQLNAKAQQQTRLLSARHTKEQADAIGKEIDALTSKLQQTEAQIRQTSPRYAALTQPQPLNLKEIQDTLDADTLLLEYSLGAERSYLWAVTPTNISSYELPKREMIETVAKRVYQLLNARNEFIKGETKAQQLARITQADAEYVAAAKELSQMVLAPVATQLGRQRLLIVSDGALQFIPFAALPDPSPTRAGRAEPLVVSHELVSLPSASTLAVLRREQKDRKPASKLLAVLADPVFARDDERVKIKLDELRAANIKPEVSITQTSLASDARAKQANEERQTTESNGSRQLVKEQLAKSAQESNATDAELRIARLPGSRREATQIMALIPERQGKLALDFAASRTTALSNDLSDYRYVHFATHGLLNSTHPELSGIVFSLVDDKGEPEDGFLRAHEVFNLKLSADLVVLSACQTGLGKEVRGEGLISLTRGFMYAGAPRVVVSLWSVDDEATASLMVGFYKAMLSRKMSPAAALRAAQIDVRKQKQRTNPYYWAAFTIQGEWR